MPLDFSKLDKYKDTPEESISPGGLDFSKLDKYKTKTSVEAEEEPSAIEAGVTGFLKGLIPTTGAIATGARAGVAAAAITPPVLPGVGPFAKPIVGGVVGVGAGILAAMGLGAGQEKVLESVAPETAARARKAEEVHPLAAHAGGLLSAAPLTGLGTKALKEIAATQIAGKPLGMGKTIASAAGIGAGFETGLEAATGQSLDPAKIAMTAAATPFMAGATKFGKGVAGEAVPQPKTKDLSFEEKIDRDVSSWKPEVKPAEPSIEAVTPLEGATTPEGIPVPQEGVETRLKALENELDYFRNPPEDYHPKDAVEAIHKANKELKTETDEDVRALLRVVKDLAKEVLEGDLHPSVVEGTGLDIRRKGNYIDVVEVPEKLQRQGIGTKIVENLETDMKAEGHKSAFLLAKDTKKSISFWEKQGYQIDPSHVHEKGENVPMSKNFREGIPKVEVIPSKTPLARTNKEGQITLDKPAIKADFEAGFPYIFSPDSPTGLQKAEVFKQLGINKEQFSQLVRTPEEYSAFLKAHEESHITNDDKSSYPRTEEGKLDLMHPDAIAIEARATQDGINTIIKEKEIPHVASIVDETTFHEAGKKVYQHHGEDAAKKFASDYRTYKDRYHVEVPKTPEMEEMSDATYNLDTKDRLGDSELHNAMRAAEKEGITPELRELWLKADDGQIKLTPEQQAVKDKILAPIKAEAEALAKKRGETTVEGYQPHVRVWDNSTVTKTLGEKWEDITRTEGAFSQKMAETPAALEERNVFAVEKPDGTRRVIQLRKDGVIEWKKGKAFDLAKAETSLKPGDSFLGGKIVEAAIHEKETNTPYRYSHDSLYNWLTRLNELRKFDRETTFLNALVKAPVFKDIGMDILNKETGKLNELPKGWVVPQHIERIPELSGKAFHPKTAVVLEDWAKTYDKSMYMSLTSMLIKNMMLNPIPHIFNEVAHAYIFRGATGWFTPKGLASFVKTGKHAVRDVLDQSPLYQEILKEGGSLLSADVRNKEYIRELHKQAEQQVFGKQTQKDIKTIAAKVGMSPATLYNMWSKASNKVMWVSRDMMYMQLVREVKMKDPILSTKEAINYVEKHMPSYRLPSEIAGSRTLSKVLGDPRIAVFSRYHHGVVKSMMETVKDVHPSKLRTEEGRKAFAHGLDSIVATGIAFGILYPLMDEVNKAVFGMDDAEQRRAGPFHLIQAAADVYKGKKDTQALIAPVFTFNPLFLYTGQLVANRQLYSGKQVFHPDDPAGAIASDVAQYTAKSIPQYGPMTQGMESEEGAKVFAAKQFDVRAKTSEQLRKADVQTKFADRNRRTRERKRKIQELRDRIGR